MRQSRSYGSVRGLLGNSYPYRDIGLCRLLGWAFGPRKLMKNCHADFIATHERPRDSQDWHGFPAHFAGNSLPVLSVPGFGAHSPRWFFAPVLGFPLRGVERSTIFRVRLSRICDIIPPMHSAIRVGLLAERADPVSYTHL